MHRIVVTDHRLEYVSLRMAIPAGSAHDPRGREGLANVASQMLLRGTSAMGRSTLVESIDHLGAGISTGAGNEYAEVVLECSSRNLQPALELLGDILNRSSFPEDELAKVVNQASAEISEIRDADASLAAVLFGQLLFRGHPYGHPIRGYQSVLPGITRSEVVAFCRERYGREDLLVGAAGDVTPERLDALLSPVLAGLPAGPPREAPGPVAPSEPGIKVLLVTKPDRSQAQVVIGQRAVCGADPRVFPLLVAVTGFGGTFTSPLVREIREKRGWSYGASSAVVPGRFEGIMTTRFSPTTRDTPDAVMLALDMLSDLAHNGPSPEDLEFASGNLVNQFPFFFDTAPRKMETLFNARLAGRADDYLDTYVEKVRSVTPEEARSALSSVIDPSLQHVVVLGDESLEGPLGRIPGVSRLVKVPHTWDGPLQ